MNCIIVCLEVWNGSTAKKAVDTLAAWGTSAATCKSCIRLEKYPKENASIKIVSSLTQLLIKRTAAFLAVACML